MDSSFRYTGHYFHARSGLTLAPYRAYEPTLGRWLNRDPIGERGGVNLYGYVGDNPVNEVDPLGLSGQTRPIPTIPIFTIPIGSEQNIALSNALTQGLTDIVDTLDDIIKECKGECSPPVGTQCYEGPDTTHGHGGLKDHYHIYQMFRFNGTCQWKYLGGKVGKGVLEIVPSTMKACSSYPGFQGR